MNLVEKIKIEEGFRSEQYNDHLGFATIGYRTKIPITEKEAELLLNHRLERMKNEFQDRLRCDFGKLPELSAEGWDVLYHMAYQLGVPRLLGFKKMIGAVYAEDYETASKEMLDSLWAKQTPSRAKRLSAEMKKLGGQK